MILVLKNVTLEDCIKLYKHGWMAVLSNGKVVDFEKENGTPDIPKSAPINSYV